MICFLSKKKKDQIRSKGIKVFKVCIGTFLNSTKKHLLTPCIWQSTLVMVCKLESKYELEWSCPFWQKKNLQQMTRAILGTIIYLHSLNTIHVHFFHDEHFFCFFRIRRQQWSMQFFGKQSPQDMQKKSSNT